MTQSVRGRLASLVMTRKRDAGQKLYVTRSIVEAAILETLYDEDIWADGISHVCGAEVEVDNDLEDGCAYMSAEPEEPWFDRHGKPFRPRMSNRLAVKKFGPRQSRRRY
jgi:hypothetical protein